MSNHGPENREFNIADLFGGSTIARSKGGGTITIFFGIDPKIKTTRYGIHLVGEQEGQRPWHSGAWGESPKAAIDGLERKPREIVKRILLETGVIFPNGSSPK